MFIDDSIMNDIMESVYPDGGLDVPDVFDGVAVEGFHQYEVHDMFGTLHVDFVPDDGSKDVKVDVSWDGRSYSFEVFDHKESASRGRGYADVESLNSAIRGAMKEIEDARNAVVDDDGDWLVLYVCWRKGEDRREIRERRFSSKERRDAFINKLRKDVSFARSEGFTGEIFSTSDPGDKERAEREKRLLRASEMKFKNRGGV